MANYRKHLTAKTTEVLDFIQKFKFRHSKELEDIFLNGNCYYFTVILKERFHGTIYYLPIANHFICKIENNYYDITGIAAMNETPIKWSELKILDETLYNKLIRDCIKFDTRK